MAKKLTFKSIHVGCEFTFAAESDPCNAMARGPWVKVGSRSYRANVEGFAHGPTHVVGSVDAQVCIVN